MEKCPNKLKLSNFYLLVRLHLHKNEKNLGSLQPLGCRSLQQQLTAPIP